MNLFYTHRNAPYYADIQEHLMTAESIVLLLVNGKDKIPNPVEGEDDIKLESPVVRWKQMLGNKDPNDARTEKYNESQDCMRGTYGVDLIKNAFHGSDNAKAANKERDIFLFPIPEKPPDFEYIRTKVTMDMILSFLFPPNLEHSNSTGRLDLFALYGPIVNYHSVDYCFCTRCIRTSKDQLTIANAEREAIDRKRMGLTGTAVTGDSKISTGAKTQHNFMAVKKLHDPPTRLLKEVDINQIYNMLCPKCQAHCDGFVHLTCGRGGQHLNSDIEIDELIREINRRDLLTLLQVEKGSIAKIMIDTLDLTEPPEIMYKEEHVRELFKDLETDYYERYEYDHLMKMVIEDRRLRMNFWISKITKKPIEKFKNPNLLNQNEKVDRRDINNPYFSLQRILPISLHMEKTKVISTDTTYDKLHFDYRSKLLQNE